MESCQVATRIYKKKLNQLAEMKVKGNCQSNNLHSFMNLIAPYHLFILKTSFWRSISVSFDGFRYKQAFYFTKSCCSFTKEGVSFTKSCCSFTKEEASFVKSCCSFTKVRASFVKSCCSFTKEVASYVKAYCSFISNNVIKAGNFGNWLVLPISAHLNV